MQLLHDYCSIHQIASPISKSYSIDDWVTFERWLKSLQAIYLKQPITGLGIEIGKMIQASHMGISAYVSQYCRNLEQYFSMSTQYVNIWYNFTPLHVDWQSDQVVISWDQPAYVQTGMYIFETAISQELMVSILWHRMQALIGEENTHLNWIELSAAKPANTDAYDIFHCPVTFSAEKTRIALPIDVLRVPLQSNDPILLDILMKQADISLENMPEANNIIEQVNLLIIESLKQQRANIDWVASQLNMSSRQLQKILKENNQSFSDCLNNVRFKLAKFYLKDETLSVLDVALLLSYNEPASFNRAFKAWTGLNPSQWRQGDTAATAYS